MMMWWKNWLCALLGLLFLSGCVLGEDGSESSFLEEETTSVDEREQQPPEEEVEIGEAVLTLTIPEGYTLARIGMTLEELGVCAVDDFIRAAQEQDYSDFPLVAEQVEDNRRCFALEGYLFPDTYQIYSSEMPEAIIRRILTHTEQKIDPELRVAIRQSGYSVHEILTMASIIEKEAFGKEHMPGISSVLHNRLAIEMRLQCDVTINYVEGAIKPFIDGDKDYYNEYYNTYKCDALPAGPICNPGIDAIRAALLPANTEYLYFVTDVDKNYYYSETWEGHLSNVERAGINTGSPSDGET